MDQKILKGSALKYFCIFFIIGIIASSCTHTNNTENLQDHRPGQHSEQDIKAHLEKNVSIYNQKQDERFFDSVAQEYYPGYREFKYQVEDFLYSHNNIELDFQIEKILTDKNEKSVEIKWFKTYIDKRGNFTKRDGFATLFFDASRNRLRLKNIKGDNPFIQ